MAPNRNLIPAWLKAELFIDILKEVFPNFKSIKEFKANHFTAPGENYSTIVLRIHIEVELLDGSGRTKAFFMKIPYDHPMINEVMAETNMIENEAGVFHEVLREIEDIYRDVGANIQFGALSYRLPIQKDYVLLEDLQAKGFKNLSRFDGLDMAHMRGVLNKLALLHAGSATRVALKGAYDEKYTRGKFVNILYKVCGEMYKSMHKPLMKCMPMYKGHETYMESVNKLHEVVIDEIWQAANIDENEFNVLQHGDVWTNNILFQHDDDGKLIETYLADFQGTHWGPPSEDLIYFIISSAQYDIKIKEFDYFIRYYHEHLVQYLQLLKYPKTIPTLRELHKSIIKNGICGYSSVICVMGAALMPTSDVSNFENFVSDTKDGDRFKMLMYSNANFRKHAELILPWLYNRGALEITIAKLK